MPIDQDEDDYADALALALSSKAEFAGYINSDTGKRSQALGEQLASARAAPWKPLDDLPAGLDCLGGSGAPIVWLGTAIDLMAFGSKDPDTFQAFERGARRYQASRALCTAAQSGEIELLAGKRGRPVDRRQLDYGRKLGAVAHTLEIDRSGELHDSAAVFDENFKTLKLVRIDRTALVAWLRAQCCGNGFEQQPDSTAREAQETQPTVNQEQTEISHFRDMSLRGSKGKKIGAVFQAMKEQWSDLRVERNLGIKEIEGRIGPGMVRRQYRTTGHADDIRRILGTKSIKPTKAEAK